MSLGKLRILPVFGLQEHIYFKYYSIIKEGVKRPKGDLLLAEENIILGKWLFRSKNGDAVALFGQKVVA